MIPVLLHYFPLLLITLVVEGAVVAASVPRGMRKHALTVCLALNLLTHPVATLFSWRWGAFLLPECFAFLFEWLGYMRLLPCGWFPAARYAFLANIASALVGIGFLIALTP